MTDRTEPRSLVNRAKQSTDLVTGTDAGIQRLHDHCDKLNAMNWVKHSGKPYLVRFNPEGSRHEIVRQGEVMLEYDPQTGECL